eukprot:5119977-Amphidinium_carterae.1
MAILCVGFLVLAAGSVDSYSFVHILVGAQDDSLPVPTTFDLLPDLEIYDFLDSTLAHEPYTWNMNQRALHNLAFFEMEIVADAHHSIADEYLKHSAGVEGNDS